MIFRLLLFWSCLAGAVAATVPAPLASEIVRRHVERAGGKLGELRTLRTEGRTFINGEVTLFTTIAARPNRLRVESFTPLRRVIQVYDGNEGPWLSHSEVGAGVAQAMSAADAKDFRMSADFDGPLVDSAAKGYSVDYAGDDILEDGPAFKLLVTDANREVFFLWVDAKTYDVVKRLIYLVRRNQRVAVETFFKDFRPVAGVRQPHRIETAADGRMVYVMMVDKITANMAVEAGTFAKP